MAGTQLGSWIRTPGRFVRSAEVILPYLALRRATGEPTKDAFKQGSNIAVDVARAAVRDRLPAPRPVPISPPVEQARSETPVPGGPRPRLSGADPRGRKEADGLISVVVCGHDGAHHLPGLLDALDRQTLPRARFEVVYVDDASTDGSVDLVERYGIAHVVRSEHRIGLPRARNAGIRAARGDVLAFTDVDTVPDERWLEAGYRLFAESGVDFLAGGIAMPVGPRPTIAALVDATTYLDQEMYVQAGYAAGANFCVRRSVAERLGGFNEHLEYYGGDDEEFGWRLRAAGVRVHYAPEVRLTHPPRVRLREIAHKAYRGGASYAVRRRLATGSRSGAPPAFRQPRSYLPPKRLRRLPRVVQLEYEPTVLELMQMHIARYLCVQLMTLAGDYVGERRWRGRAVITSDATPRAYDGAGRRASATDR